MDEPLKHHAEWREPDIKGRISYGPIYLKCLEQANPETVLWLPGAGGGEWGVTAKEDRVSSWV